MKKSIIYLSIAVGTLFCTVGSAQIITTIAGNGSPGFSGDGGQAQNAQLNGPYGTCYDASGNLYIADALNNRIRKMSPNGVIITFAGNGTAGFSGDGMAATSAQLHRPVDVALDAAGNLYIADENNYVIRKVNTSGIISTAAGIGLSNGNSGNGGAATSAQLTNPNTVTIDNAGNMYIGQYLSNVIRIVNTSGIINNFAGNGTGIFGGDNGPATSASLQNPAKVVADNLGNVYIADEYNQRIRKVNSSGIITTVVGNGTAGFGGDGGPATSASINYCEYIQLDASGNLYIADKLNNRIRMVNSSGVINTIAGTGTAGYTGNGGPPLLAEFHTPEAISFDAAGNWCVSDWANNVIRRIANCDTLKVSITGTDSTCVGASVLLTAHGGTTYTWSSNAGSANTSTVLVTPTVTTVYTLSATNGACTGTVSFTVNVNGGSYTRMIITYAGTGVAGFSGDGGQATSAQLQGPYGTCFDASGNFYIADALNHRIRKITPSGVITTFAGTGTPGYSGDGGPATSAEFHRPSDVAIDAAGNIYVADENNFTIRKINTSGIVSTIAGTGVSGYSGDNGPATAALLSAANTVSTDHTGNIYIGQYLSNTIRKIDASGIITTFAGISGFTGSSGDGGPASSALLYNPAKVIVDNAGNVYIADEYNQKIRMVTPTGIISTVVGNGTAGYSGDGGPATLASINYCEYIQVDASGNLYIADKLNERLRMVNTSGIISTIAGNGVAGYAGDGGNPLLANLQTPETITIGPNGNIFVSDWANNAIREIIDPCHSPLAGINNYAASKLNKNEILVYPNPTSGNLTVDVENSTETSSYSIYNIMGQEVLAGKISPENNHIDLTMLSNGLYTLIVTQNGKSGAAKVNVVK